MADPVDISAGLVPKMVPLIAPDGTSGEVPEERLKDAITAGAKPGVWFRAPDGSPGIIPQERVLDAVKAGGTPFGSRQALDLYSQAQQQAAAIHKNAPPVTDPSMLDSIQRGVGSFVSDLYQTGKGLATMVLKPPETTGEKATAAVGGPLALPAKRAIEGYYDAVQHHLDEARKAANNGDTVGSLFHSVSAGLPLVGPLIGDVYDKANSGDLAGAIGLGASRILQAASLAPEGSSIPNPLDIATKAVAKIPSPRPSPESLGLAVSPQALDSVPARSTFQPALSNTPREALEYAQSKGIKLTPGEATYNPVAATVQSIGERSMLGGAQLADARMAEKMALQKNVSDFADRMDPHRMGTSDAEAGDHIQRDAQVAMQVAKDNANQAYSSVADKQVNIAGDVSGLKDWTDSLQNVRQPGAAAARPVYQAPAVRAALADIASKPEALGPNPSIESMRNLRSEFWEKGNDYTGNIPDSARGLYKQAAGKVDDAIMDAAKGTDFEPAFRDANSQWKTLQQKYNTPGQPLARILQQSDPARITNDLLNRASATDVQTLKGENMQGAIQALRRQVIIDVANKGFRVNGDGLAGYSDGFLNQLFGRPSTKELYLNAELARRMGFQENPSGTSNVLLGKEQMTSMNPAVWMIPKAAARVSMPREAGSFLPKTPTAGPALGPGWVRGPGGRIVRALPAASSTQQQLPGGTEP